MGIIDFFLSFSLQFAPVAMVFVSLESNLTFLFEPTNTYATNSPEEEREEEEEVRCLTASCLETSANKMHFIWKCHHPSETTWRVRIEISTAGKTHLSCAHVPASGCHPVAPHFLYQIRMVQQVVIAN